MADNFVWQLPPLDASEEPTALIPVSAVGSMDVTHKMDIEELVGHQQALNPLEVSTQRLVLARYTNTALASQTTPNLLDFIDNPVRHSFDTYDYLVAGIVINSSEDVKPETIEIEAWNGTHEDNKIALWFDDISIWRISDNSFGISDQTNTIYLKYLYGYRILPYLASLDVRGLRFESEAMYIFKENETLSVTLPKAVGGSEPYTYSATGLGTFTFNATTRQLTIPADTTTLSSTYRVTDDDGQTASIPLVVNRYRSLGLPRISPNLDTLPTTITFPNASGGVPPYSHSVRAYHRNSFGGPDVAYDAGFPTASIRGPSGNRSFLRRVVHSVRDAIGQTASQTYTP